jgi:hypothetical protein
MPTASFNKVLDDLKNSLRDLEKVQMTAPDDPELLNLKQEIRKMIKRAQDTAKRRAE